MSRTSTEFQEYRCNVLGVAIQIVTDSPEASMAIQNKYPPNSTHSCLSGPHIVEVVECEGQWRIRFEERQAFVRRDGKWPRLDELIQLLVQRERRDLVFIHGSSVMLNVGAALFFGMSNAGKTTLALALNQAGAALMAEDLTPCLIETGEIIPYLTRPNLRADTVAIAERYQWKIDPDTDFATNRSASVPVQCIYHVVPKTASSANHIRQADFTRWHSFRALAGLGGATPSLPTCATIPQRRASDFDRTPEIVEATKSSILHELLKHSALPEGLTIDAALAWASRLCRPASTERLHPGHLDATTGLILERRSCS